MLAAELVAPLGGVIISDQAEAMLEGARARALAAGPQQRRVPGAERRMDRPAGRERRRGAVPLGLHADGRPGRGAGGDAARAAPRRARRAGGVGRARAQPLGAASRAGADRARAAPPPGPQSEQRPGPVRARRAPRACASCSSRRASPRCDVEALDLARRHASFEELWETTLDLSRGFHDAVLSRPERGDRRDQGVAGRALRAVHRRRRHARRSRRARWSRPRAPDPKGSRSGAAGAHGRAAWIACAQCSTTTTQTFTCSTARPSRSSATAPRATPTRST